MPRTNQDGKDIRLVVSWLCGRFISDAEMAEALAIPTTNYSRRKSDGDFPSFEELNKLADSFSLSALALQVAFGYLDAGVVLLDDEGMRQYVQQGGGDTPSFPQRRDGLVNCAPAAPAPRRRRRADAPPGP